MNILINFEIEAIHPKDIGNNTQVIELPELTMEEKNVIDPIVAPTSGLRIQIFQILSEEHYFLPKRNLYLFLRVFKAISHVYKELKNNQNLKILIVTDDRPSKDYLLKYCSEIFVYEGFEIYHQQDVSGESKVSSPYGAASVALYPEIDLTIVLTASHNDLSWNGIKFYIEYPMPMSGNTFKEISQKALSYNEIHLKTDYTPVKIDSIQKNNDYIIELLSNVIEIQSLRDKNIVIWPYLGKAEGIVKLFKHYGANITLIEEELNPPNPIKLIKEEKLKSVMEQANSDIALLLDADRDRIALFIKQNGQYFTYIPNEVYSALHNILSREFGKRIINVRTIPTDLRSDESSFVNILTGVGYKHLGIIMYFLSGIDVEQSKIDTAILYLENENKDLIKISRPTPLRNLIVDIMEKNGIVDEQFLMVYWEESGGHTLNILSIDKDNDAGEYQFHTKHTLIADKYPVPALVLITELLCRGYVISESIDWTIKGINRTIPATDEEKVEIMRKFLVNDGQNITIDTKDYKIKSLSDNNNMVDIYQLKSNDSTLYFRPSGTGPEVRFYIFGKVETHLNEIKKVMDYISANYK